MILVVIKMIIKEKLKSVLTLGACAGLTYLICTGKPHEAAVSEPPSFAGATLATAGLILVIIIIRK